MTGILSESRHVTLTKPLHACEDSGAFSETTEGALFLPGAKDVKTLTNEGAILVSATLHLGKARGRVLVTVSESLLILAGFRGRLSVGR